MTVFWAIVLLLFWTFVPGLELRASIPFGWFNAGVREALSLPAILGVILAANVGVGVITYALMGPVVTLLRRWSWFDRRIWPRFERARLRLHPYVEKYGEWGVAFFIGMPFPGTGAYTGAIGSYLLGLDKRKFMLANVAGVLMAGVAVSAICLLLQEGVVADESWLKRLFLKKLEA
jgi:uncharacterized membrane protein